MSHTRISFALLQGVFIQLKYRDIAQVSTTPEKQFTIVTPPLMSLAVLFNQSLSGFLVYSRYDRAD